jgi:hypothetical protein
MDDIRTTNTANEPSNVNTSRADRERSLDALHALEVHAGSAAPGREHDWLTDVQRAITVLEHALAIQEGNSTPDDGLLSAIEQDEPRLRHRVAELRQRYRAIQDDVTALSRQLDRITPTDMIDFTDIRQKLERIAGELRYQRARETDLVYEAYAVDIGEGD